MVADKLASLDCPTDGMFESYQQVLGVVRACLHLDSRECLSIRVFRQ